MLGKGINHCEEVGKSQRALKNGLEEIEEAEKR